jgi:hypothetical protein
MGSSRGALVCGARHRRAGVIRLLLFLGGALALYQFARTQKEAELPRIVYDLDEDGNVTLAPEPGAAVVTLEPATMDAWRALVAAWPEPLEVKASYRPVGGAAKSKHKIGKALDVKVPAAGRPGASGAIQWRRAFVAAAQRAGFTGFGLGVGTIHIDTGPARWWTYSGGAMVGHPEKFSAAYADRVPPEFAAAGNQVPDLTGSA